MNIFQLHPSQSHPSCMVTQSTWHRWWYGQPVVQVHAYQHVLACSYLPLSNIWLGAVAVDSSVCSGRPFIHILSICQLTGYVLILICPMSFRFFLCTLSFMKSFCPKNYVIILCMKTSQITMDSEWLSSFQITFRVLSPLMIISSTCRNYVKF